MLKKLKRIKNNKKKDRLESKVAIDAFIDKWIEIKNNIKGYEELVKFLIILYVVKLNQ